MTSHQFLTSSLKVIKLANLLTPWLFIFLLLRIDTDKNQ